MIPLDNARTPVQWTPDASTSAGFTTEGTQPWMRLNDNYPSINISSQLASPNSILSFYKHMIQLRKSQRALFIHGRYEVVDPDDEEMVCFVKHAVVAGKETGKVAVVVLNFGEVERGWRVEDVEVVRERRMRCLVGNLSEGERVEGRLAAWEGRVYVEEE